MPGAIRYLYLGFCKKKIVYAAAGPLKLMYSINRKQRKVYNKESEPGTVSKPGSLFILCIIERSVLITRQPLKTTAGAVKEQQFQLKSLFSVYHKALIKVLFLCLQINLNEYSIRYDGRRFCPPGSS